MAAAMNAMLTKYLKDFSVPETTALVGTTMLSSLADSSPLGDLGDMNFLSEPEPQIDLEAERKEAFDEGYAKARAELEEHFAGQLVTIAEDHQHEVVAQEERHDSEVMRVIHARFFDMTVAIDADVARRSVTALADAVRKAMTEEKAADVLVRGPMRLYEMLKPKFDERGIACRHVEAETIDILVEINESVLTTRLSVWAQSLAEVME
jgi:L-lactate utilization protein LutC